MRVSLKRGIDAIVRRRRAVVDGGILARRCWMRVVHQIGPIGRASGTMMRDDVTMCRCVDCARWPHIRECIHLNMCTDLRRCAIYATHAIGLCKVHTKLLRFEVICHAD